MLAKLTSKNQLTLPKTAVQSVGAPEYFDVEVRDGQIVLTPVRIQRGDAVRGKLAALGLTGADVAEAVPSAVRAIASWSALAAVEPFVRTKVAAAPAGRASPRPTVRMLAPRRAAPRWRPAYWLRDTGMVLGNGNRAWDTVP